MSEPTPQGPGLLSLPTELHIQISSSLPYPDALALKHTNRRFYSVVQTGIKLKVAWLLERKRLNLEWPEQTCDFKTDERFCVGKVRDLMEKRRRHQECPSLNKGCKVIEGTSCTKKRAVGQIRRMWNRCKPGEVRREFIEILVFLIAALWTAAGVRFGLSY